MHNLDVPAETGFCGGCESAVVALERFELEVNGVQMRLHVRRVVRGVAAAVERAVVSRKR